MTTDIQPDNPQSIAPQRESLKLLIIGSASSVTRTIHSLHCRGFAEVGDWSPLQPTSNPGEVMSILVRQLLVDKS
ncbi:MAG: hypothetical protein SWY16_25745 [Cyanobacteriota bacterium]|nr:hypothetical protein [Cyanobacteriota bacterium]